MSKIAFLQNSKKCIFVLVALVAALLGTGRGLYAQTAFPGGDYWSLDAGFGMTGLLVEGKSYQGILDPKIWLSPSFMAGSRLGIGWSTDEILSFEGQAYLRWNFLRLGQPEKPVNVFVQGGLGMVAAYRGTNTPFDDLSRNRGSLMADVTAGVTIPLNSRWHIEPSIRAGYPHIAGFAITAGYKIPLPNAINRAEKSSNEIIRQIRIASVEHIMFGPDIGQYNADIDCDTMKTNDLILDNIVKVLNENPDYRVRIEGHANPVTFERGEEKRLMELSRVRANTIAAQLREKGIEDNQMVISAFGGTRTITRDYDIRNRNRRVELIVIRVDA